MNSPAITRRAFLRTAAISAGALTLPTGRAAEAIAAERVSFFVIGDTHYLADSEHPEALDPVSRETSRGLIDTLNRLPGTEIPGAGTVPAPRGLIHVGDLIDSGTKTGAIGDAMQQTEWREWLADFGLTGTDGRLKYPVCELHGNHDSTQGTGLVIEHLKARTKVRPGVNNRSPNGLHYSWDWGHVHFVCLGIIVGTVKETTRQRRYAALDSLDFLIGDLAANVGDSGRPVVILHHVDVARYSGPCDPAAPFSGKEWDVCDVHGYYEAIRRYQIAAIFYGHTHVRNVFRWDGTGPKAEQGLPVFNVSKASHFKDENQAFFHVEMSDRELVVREYKTTDRWQTAAWTPTAWTVPLKAPVAG